MSNAMTIAGARPSYLPAAAGGAEITDLTSGVSSSFPILRTKGKVWAISSNGQTKQLLTAEGYPIPALRVVLVKANKHVSKTFYKSGYSDGDNAPPACWSFDGVKPDASVQAPCATSCAACPNNRIGSKISESGSRVKACPDVRRVALLEPKTGTLMLLRLPYTSMKSLADFAVDLSRNSPPVNYNEVLTEISFDIKEAFPKVVFKPVRWLSEEEAAQVQEALEGPQVQEILGGGASEFAHEEHAPAPAPAPIAGARPAQRPATPVAETFDMPEEEEVPAPAPAPAPKPAARKPAAAKPATPAPRDPVVVESGSLEDALAAALKLG